MIDRLHIVRSVRAGKPVRWYIYAYRGGPCIAKIDGPTKPKLKRAEIEDLLKATERQPETIGDAIRLWRANNEWKTLAATTRRTWGSQLNAIERKWGGIKLHIWNDARMVAKVVKWRDSRADTPRAADIGVTVLRELLDFARLRAPVTINVATGIPTLYRGGDRETIIWTPDDTKRFAEANTDYPQVIDGLRLATFTGFRCADLVSLTFDEVGEVAIVKTAGKKSRGRRRIVTIPVVPGLRELIDELRTRFRKPGVETVLVNSFGDTWASGGFTKRFMEGRDRAGIVEPANSAIDMPKRKKHLHDVRGTFATKLILSGLTDREVADIMGWSPERVATIRRVYVDQARVVVAIGERIRDTVVK